MSDEMDLPQLVASKVATWIPIPASEFKTNTFTFLGEFDLMGSINLGMTRAFDRMAYPWKYPDRPHWPNFDPFPRYTRIEAIAKEWATIARHPVKTALQRRGWIHESDRDYDY